MTSNVPTFIQNGRTDKMVLRQGEAEGVHHHHAIITGNVKDKERILKAAREKQLPTKEFP